MNRERALALQKRGLHDWIAVLGASSEGARTLDSGRRHRRDRPGLPAALDLQLGRATRAPRRSAPRSSGSTPPTTTPGSPRGPSGSRSSTARRSSCSSRRATSSTARRWRCRVELDRFADVEVGDLDWDTDADPLDLGRLNDLAYGLAGDECLAPCLSSPPMPQLRLYQARVEGAPACVLGTIDHDRDLGFYFVATHPERRGGGLASRLIAAAVSEALDRGLETSSLQGSAMGQSVYRRLGYGDDFALNMYERRR